MIAQIVSSVTPVYEPRKCSFTLFIEKDTLADLATALDNLRAVLVPGMVVRSAIRPSRKLTVRLDGQPKIGVVGTQGAKYVGPFGWRSTIPLVADDPFWQDESDTVTTGITTTYTDLLTGTGPCGIDVDIAGPATNPIITLADYNSTAKLTAAPVITIASGDLLRISRSTRKVQKRVSGVWSDAWDVMPIGFDFFEARQAWFRYYANSWVKIKTTAGTLSATHRKRWA